MFRSWTHNGPVTRETVTLSLAAYLVAATLGGWLHVHAHDGECAHEPAAHAGHDHHHAGHAHHHHHHAEHAHSHAPAKAPASPVGDGPSHDNPLHDEHCAACQFAAEQVLPVSLVVLVETSELCRELISLLPPAPRGMSLEHAHARAPPQTG